MESMAFAVSLKDSMRLSALFSAGREESKGLHLIAYRRLGDGRSFLSGCWWGGQREVSAREFQHLYLLIGAVNEHGLPRELTNA